MKGPDPFVVHVGIGGSSPVSRPLGVVELQHSPERPLRLATVQRWRRDTPQEVQFTLKALPAITHPPRSGDRGRIGHFRDTPLVRRAWKETVELARAADAQFVIFQSPSSFKPTDENTNDLIGFFEWAHRDRLRFGWEPRGQAWTDDTLWTLCRELSLTHVVDPFQRKTVRGRPPYYRLHGINGYRHRYTDDELAELRVMCDAATTYCVFNNVSAAHDAERFVQLSSSPPVAEP